jgi:hypothetical protein
MVSIRYSPNLVDVPGNAFMRATDDRYRGEQGRFDLALRMIGHEARTGTIRYWTGLSDDRIRKLYTSYFKFSARGVRRRRGKSPRQIAPLVESPLRALESGVLTNLLTINGLCSLKGTALPALRNNIDLGHRFCECYETYRGLVDTPSLTFEWCWNLLVSVRRGDEIGIDRCSDCRVVHVYDRLAMPRPGCPVCTLFAVN